MSNSEDREPMDRVEEYEVGRKEGKSRVLLLKLPSIMR